MAGFCELAVSLRTPKLGIPDRNRPTVSGRYLKYSRFWETAAGDGFDLHCVAGAPVEFAIVSDDPVIKTGNFRSRNAGIQGIVQLFCVSFDPQHVQLELCLERLQSPSG